MNEKTMNGNITERRSLFMRRLPGMLLTAAFMCCASRGNAGQSILAIEQLGKAAQVDIGSIVRSMERVQKSRKVTVNEAPSGTFVVTKKFRDVSEWEYVAVIKDLKLDAGRDADKLCDWKARRISEFTTREECHKVGFPGYACTGKISAAFHCITEP